MKVPVITAVLLASSVLGYLCYERTRVWHNTKTLWEDVIKKYPYRIQTSYKNLGNYYADLGPTNPVYYDSAFTNYETLVKIKMADAGTWSNIANIYGLRKNFDSSLIAYGMALKLDSTSFDAHLDRAITYSMMKRYNEALADYNIAYKLEPKSEKLLDNRASTYLNCGQYVNAINDYTALIGINPDVPMNFLDRGAAEWDAGQYQSALADFTYYHKIDPNNGQCLFNLAVTYEKLKDFKNALTYAQMAKDVKFQVKDEYLNFLKQQINHPSK
jgi:tetratricopeptide (TPR) repeat protein